MNGSSLKCSNDLPARQLKSELRSLQSELQQADETSNLAFRAGQLFTLIRLREGGVLDYLAGKKPLNALRNRHENAE